MTYIQKEPIIPLNIWNNIERCWVERLDIVYEGETIAGIHHTDWTDAIYEIDRVCRKLQAYKKELMLCYGLTDKINGSSLEYSHIYVFKCLNSGLYKVGRSINPRFREKTIQSEQPNVINIFVSPITDKSVEKKLHRIFKEKRVRGEWFRLTEDDILFIKNYNYGAS